MPVYTYALMESALRAKAGESPEEHRRTITGLWSRLSEVAAGNPYAWLPQAHTPEQLATPDADNRMISEPYPKLLCANLQVDLAAGVVVTSVAAATALGIAQDKWVFLHAGAAAYDEWFVSERRDLAASPAIRAIGRGGVRARRHRPRRRRATSTSTPASPPRCRSPPSELGLPVDDPERPLSVTGGLTFAGGPGNNYGTHAVATLVDRLRRDPESVRACRPHWAGSSPSTPWASTRPPRRARRTARWRRC